MLDKFRSTKYYKLCGNICGILSLIILFLLSIAYYFGIYKNLDNNMLALLLVPVFVVLFFLIILKELLFIIFSLLAIGEMSKNENTNISKPVFFTDFGYFLTFTLFFGSKIFYLAIGILSKMK